MLIPQTQRRRVIEVFCFLADSATSWASPSSVVWPAEFRPLPLPGDIRYRFDLGGGASMDTGCYAIHMNRTVAGEEPEVRQAEARTARPGSSTNEQR